MRMERALRDCDRMQSLTEGIHTKEALDLVREHVRGIMGPAAVAFSNAMIKMSKLQAAQVGPLSLQPTERPVASASHSCLHWLSHDPQCSPAPNSCSHRLSHDLYCSPEGYVFSCRQ